jgi:hypothetical protein
MKLVLTLYTVLLLVSCATNKSSDMVLLPPGKLYIDNSQSSEEVVYKDEHSAGSSCRVWH